MGRRLWGQWFETSDMAATIPLITQKFKLSDSAVLRAVRPMLIFYNNPAFTSLSMELWDDQGGYPGQLKATSSNVRTKVQLLTLNNGFKTTWFEFLTLPPLRAETYYHLTIRGLGYTGTDTSHVAWAKQFPDAIYGADETGHIYLGVDAFWAALITGKF